MELFKKQTKINFMGLCWYTGGVSLIFVLLSIGLLFFKGINFGLEFTGGMQIELRFSQPVDLDALRTELLSHDYEDVRLQYYGSTQDVLVRLAGEQGNEKKLSESLIKTLQAHPTYKQVQQRRIEYIGAEVGEQLAEQGGIAVLIAILATMVYIALRFEYRLALSAALALSHDAIIVLGIFSFFQLEFDLASLAAILAVMGYSLNDTIVVFDRVRENFRLLRKASVKDIINLSINQTLSRTIMTSFLTLLVVIALLMYGGEGLFGFSLALFLGIVIGTYSSIYVSGAMAMGMGLSREDLSTKSKTVIDDLP